jgi:class 3 adenylate cyclase
MSNSEIQKLELSSMKVLVVDDSRTLRKVLARELGKIGITQIAEAEDGRQALEQLNVQSFDLMLLDMEMPELDGIGVLEHLKQQDRLKSIPVIVISGAEELEKTVKCIEMGAEDYLPKNFNPVLLAARVLSSFEKKRLRDREIQYLEQLKLDKEKLLQEQQKTDRLMLNILPSPIAERLKNNEVNIANHFEDVTILFSDLVGFTQMASQQSAIELVTKLNFLFSRFDLRAKALGLEKIKTIGDAYMLVGGVPTPRADHADVAAQMALGMFEDLAVFNHEYQTQLQMRIGLHSGPVVAGVIGFTKFSYDLWGNSVNLASRMESTSLPGQVQVSSFTRSKLSDRFTVVERDWIECKGIGKVMTFFLQRQALQ